MPFRRKKSATRKARQALEGGASVAAGYAGGLSHKIADNAPIVKDHVTTTLGTAAGELLRRVPDVVDRLPDQVSDRLPAGVQPKPKNHRLRKLLIVGGIAGAGGFVYTKVKGGQKPAPKPAYTPPPATSTGSASTTPPKISENVEKLADGAAPDVVK